MKQIVTLLRKKSHLMYMINCIEGYVEDKYYDKNLSEIWDTYNKELEDINKELEDSRVPALEEYEKSKLELLKKIKEQERDLELSRNQLKELNQIVSMMKK